MNEFHSYTLLNLEHLPLGKHTAVSKSLKGFVPIHPLSHFPFFFKMPKDLPSHSMGESSSNTHVLSVICTDHKIYNRIEQNGGSEAKADCAVIYTATPATVFLHYQLSKHCIHIKENNLLKVVTNSPEDSNAQT